MSETPVNVFIDCSKPIGEQETIVPVTAEELALAAAARDAAEEVAIAEAAAETAKAALKDSARNKLIAGEPLTAEEAALLVM